MEVNKFDKSSGRWQHGNFVIDKFSNFQGCQINFLIKKGWLEFHSVKIDRQNKVITRCLGFVCAIVKDFSSALNYTYHMNMAQGQGKTLFPYSDSDVVLQSGSINDRTSADRENEYVLTRPIFYMEHFITMPPGEELNGYERMILPFDEPTWMWIGITFGSAFATIFVLRFMRPEFVNFVIGKSIASPALNVLRAFFGVSQIICPRRNFARFLLMMLILFSLIVRTAYQGKMFEFLQKELRKPTVKTIDEMIENNFTFYMQLNSKLHFPESDLMKR